MRAKYIQQIATNVSSATLEAIDRAAEAEAICRAAWVRRAIERVLSTEAADGRA